MMTEKEYESALAEINELMDKGETNTDKFESLVEKVCLYESIHYPFATHLVSFYGLKCYVADDDVMWAKNKYLDWMIPVLSCVHNFFTDIACFLFPSFEPKGFPLEVIEDYTKVT